MNTVTKKASLFATLMAAGAMVMAPAKADELVSLETAIEMMVKQQAAAVFHHIQQDIAIAIEQELGNFNINSSFKSDKGTPSVEMKEIARINLDNVAREADQH